jgi:plastocyanin
MNIPDRSFEMPGALRRSAGPGFACAAVLAAAAGLASAADKPGAHTVVMQATSYSPAALTVKRGDTVVWRNDDPFPHTATAAKGFDSKSIPAGGSWTFEPRVAGDYSYTCTFHPNMKATLRVE